MQDIYDEMMTCSRRIAAAFPQPAFYQACARELNESRVIYDENPFVAQCRDIVSRDLAHNPSHGLDHAEKVAVEAGALVFVEGVRIGMEEPDTNEAATLVQVAGLLHDMRRGDEEHAKTGAAAARVLLEGLSVSRNRTDCVVQAITNHEAFVEPEPIESNIGRLVSNTLYDADKFRWGPDNFTVTLWEMMRFSHAPVATVIPHFPQGMAGVSRIKSTFRSLAGKAYGPEFIDLGLHIGHKIHEFLKERFAEEVG